MLLVLGLFVVNLFIMRSFFKRLGDKITFICQLLPVARTFISLPPGILKVDFKKFIFYTFSGAFIWCTLLAGGAYLLGEQWKQISEYMKKFEVVIVLIVIGVVLWLINAYIPMQATIKKILNAVVIICVVIVHNR